MSTVRVLLTTTGVTLAFASGAFAFAPSAGAPTGIEPQRVWRSDRYAQHRLAASHLGWRSFAAGEGKGWTVDFDQLTGDPHTLSGPGIALRSAQKAIDIESEVRAFFRRQQPLIGVSQAALSTRSVNYSAFTHTWYLDFDTIREGTPIWRGGVTARVKHGRLVLVRMENYPTTAIVNQRVLSAPAAMRVANLRGPEPAALRRNLSTENYLLPVEEAGRITLRHVYRVRSESDAPRGQWSVFVDAETATIRGWYNDVRYIGGELAAERDARTVNGDTVIEGVPLAPVTSSDGTVYTDWDGRFETAGEAVDLNTSFAGQYARVLNQAGAESTLPVEASTLWATDNDAQRAEIDAYMFVHHVKEWGKRMDPSVSMVSDRFNVYVNEEQSCNAYYDGSIHFFRPGDGCNNTGRIADVVYHEWGHGFHYTSIESGVFDGSLSEGASDVVSILQTGDPHVAPLFFTNGQPIRKLDIVKVYPEDFQNNDLAVHSNGLIYGGAMWDLWQRLNDDVGEAEGKRAVENIFVGMLKGGPSIPTAYDEAVVADDDDGNLTNGTPHLCAVIDAFARHGLGPAAHGNSLVQLMHEPTALHAANAPVAIRAVLSNLAPACVPFNTESATLHWRVAMGEWQTTALTLEAAPIASPAVSGAIPAQTAGQFVEYYLTVAGTDGAVSAPADGERAPYSYYAGDTLEVSCQDFESSDGRFRHELVAGTPALGADDWQWGIPMGEAGDPTQAHSGRFVWGNDLGDGDYNGAYQETKSNRLSSPEIDTRHYEDAFLSYYRWLTVEDGLNDQAEVSADGETLWSNYQSETGDLATQDRGWVAHVVDLAGAADDGSVMVSWSMAADDSQNLGGWNIDDVCIYAPNTPNNRLGISDFNATNDDENAVYLSWTQPTHDPVTQVRVVRKHGEWPTGPDDGDIVYNAIDPELGSAASYADTDVRRKKTYYYAVYAHDGQSWLSWTREGLNADMGYLRRGEGCGCSSQPPPVSVISTLAAAMLLCHRRGRRRSLTERMR